jgi:hypothetical protein
MVSHLFFYQLVLVALVWLCVMLQWVWPSDPATVCPTTPEPPGPRPKRHHKPTPFAGLTKKPRCDACEHASAPHSEAPRTPPPRIVPARGRRRQVDTSTHFCPNPDCIYRGWVGWGNLRANGHPNGGSWRQLVAYLRAADNVLGSLPIRLCGMPQPAISTCMTTASRESETTTLGRPVRAGRKRAGIPWHSPLTQVVQGALYRVFGRLA